MFTTIKLLAYMSLLNENPYCCLLFLAVLIGIPIKTYMFSSAHLDLPVCLDSDACLDLQICVDPLSVWNSVCLLLSL